MKWQLAMASCSCGARPSARTGCPASRPARTRSRIASSARASWSPALAMRRLRSMTRSAVARSASASSRSSTSMSLRGDTSPATCTTLSSSKQRTTWAMAWVSRMWARNWLPRPSPLAAPATRPAMSTNSIALGTTRAGCTMSAMRCRRGSGTGTTPVFGSMVQNGKFSALTAAWVMALNSVDLPTFGSPTMPQLKPIAWFYVRRRARAARSSPAAYRPAAGRPTRRPAARPRPAPLGPRPPAWRRR